MNINKAILLISLTFLSFLSFAQIEGEEIQLGTEGTYSHRYDSYIDSVKLWMANEKRDCVKVLYMADLAFLYAYKNPKLVHEYGEKAIKMADSMGYAAVKIYAKTSYADALTVQGQYLKVLELNKEAYQLQLAIGDTSIHITINNLGDAYMELNDYENAYKYFQESLKMSRNDHDTLMEAISMFNIGRVYKIQKNYPKALEYIYSSKLLSDRVNDIEGIAYSFYELGQISRLEGELEDAVIFFEKSITVSDSLGVDELTAQSMVAIANIHETQNKYLKSLEFYYKALNINERVKNILGLSETYLGLGKLQIKMNSMESASSSLHRGLLIAINLKDKDLEASYYEALSIFYEKKGRLEQSLDFYKKFKLLMDSVFNQENNMQIALLQTQFDSEKKDKEIAQLNMSKAKQNSKIHQQRSQNTLLVTGLVFVLVISIVLTLTIVNKRRANEILRAQKREIEEKSHQLSNLNRVKDKFFSIISHDLKSPFQSLSGVLELMTMKALSDKDIKKLFKELKIKFDSTNDLLENLLHWARIQMKEITFDPDAVELYDTIDEELQTIQGYSIKEVKVENKVEELSRVHADINMLKLVIRNLVNNAIKYTENKGKVEVISEDMGDYVCVSVKDNGVGISEENIHRLFDSESSFTTLGTNLERGTGLGLNLCKEFIEMQGGKIWVESEEGKGSTFKFTLRKAS